MATASLLAPPAPAMIISASRDASTQGAGLTADWRGVGKLMYRGSPDDPIDPIDNQYCTGTVLRHGEGGSASC